MTKTINFQGKNVEVEEVDVLTSNEPWNEYQLSDGKVMSVKTILVSVHRAIHERTPNDEPLYITKTSNIVKVS